MNDAEPSSTWSTARQPRPSRHWFSSRLWGRLTPVLLVAPSLAGTLLFLDGRAAASQASDLQAEAAQLSQQLVLEQLQVGVFEHQYEIDTIRVDQDAAAISAVQQRVTKDRSRVRSDRIQLTAEAVSSYMNAGSLALNPTLQLFSGDRQEVTNRAEYESVAVGNTNVTLALLHTDEVQLQASEAVLAARSQQDRAAQGAAANATAQAQQVATELAGKQALVQGQLAVAVAADREQQAQQAVAVRAAVGGAVSDAPLPPFLQCVVQAESGGNYAAVSPDGNYMGAFQFSQSTWNEAAQLAGLPQLIGVPPNTASKADQDTIAIALYDADGEQPWDDSCHS